MNEIVDEINKLKKEKNAIILAHNYQIPDIQDIADFVGDSLDLSKKAKATDINLIVFCGVQFMAETAKILSPQKTVLLPEKDAGCPMAEMITSKDVRDLRKKYPDAAIVAYVNTNADVKAEVDVCCTSANAVKVVNSLPERKIVFLPDKNLGHYVKINTKKEVILWWGYCPVHDPGISLNEVKKMKNEYPEAVLMVHPEAPPEVVDIADYVLSTNGMVKTAKELDKKEFIVGTEEGLTYRLKKENPDKEFYRIKTAVCVNMKKTNLTSVLNALRHEQYKIELPEDTIIRAKRALDRMLKYS